MKKRPLVYRNMRGFGPAKCKNLAFIYGLFRATLDEVYLMYLFSTRVHVRIYGEKLSNVFQCRFTRSRKPKIQ